MEVDDVWRLFHHPADQLLAREELRVIRELDASIERLEEYVLKRARKLPEYQRLLSIPGIGEILGMTIALETGEISRFPTAGDFASYCRTVRSERTSNSKRKGENNTKCGNRYLGWAFVEAANFAQRYDAQARSFYERKKARRNQMVATKALACKLAKAAWHLMSGQVDYDGQRVFGGGPKPAPAESSLAKDRAPGVRKVSFLPGTKVEMGKGTEAGETLVSPVEETSTLDQAALGLRSRRALSSAGMKQDKKPMARGNPKRKAP